MAASLKYSAQKATMLVPGVWVEAARLEAATDVDAARSSETAQTSLSGQVTVERFRQQPHGRYRQPLPQRLCLAQLACAMRTASRMFGAEMMLTSLGAERISAPARSLNAFLAFLVALRPLQPPPRHPQRRASQSLPLQGPLPPRLPQCLQHVEPRHSVFSTVQLMRDVHLLVTCLCLANGHVQELCACAQVQEEPHSWTFVQRGARLSDP